MTTKRLFRAFNMLLITGIMFAANTSFAQRQYATTVSASNSSLFHASQPASLAVDGTNGNNMATAARVSTTTAVGLTNNGFIELQFPALDGNVNVPANTTAYIKINLEQSAQLQALVGGTVGNLLSAVLGIVVGQQGLQVSAVSSTGVTAFTTSSDFTQNRLRIVRDAAGSYYIKVTPSGEYNRIRVTNRINGLLATRYLDVFGGFYVKGNVGCSLGTYTSYNAAGIVSLNALNPEGVTNIQNAIDGNAATFSSLNLATLGVGSYIEQTVYFEGVPPVATDRYNIKLGINSGLLTLNILSGVQIIAYNGANQVYSAYLNDNAFINLNLNTAITNNQPISLSILPGQVIDRITVRLNGLANANALTQSINLYEVTKGSFAVNLAVAGGNGNSFRRGVPATITANVTGCNGPFTYAWSGNGLVGNTNVLTVPNNVDPGNYTYTVTVTDAYGVSQSAQTTITVEQPPVPGTITGATTVCSGDAPPTLNITGSIGSVVRWERSSTSNFAGSQTISNTTTTLAGTALGTITSTVYVRALIRNNSYADVYTPVVALTVKSSTWNGSVWSNGVPDIGTAVFITGNYSQDVDLNGCTLEVSNNAVVSFPTGKTVTLNKYIKVNSGGSVTFENNAHLIQLTAAVNEGDITLKRNSSSLYRLDYTLWSSPVVGQQLLAFSPATSVSRFYEYKYAFDANANDGAGAFAEQYFIVDPTTNFETGKGYLIRMPNVDNTPGYNSGTTPITHVGRFTGVPVNGPVTKALSTQGDRYTAIGNPYPSPINVHAFFTANESILEPTAALYFWRKKNNYLASSYATLTRDAYVYNYATGGNQGEEQFGGQQWDTFFRVTTPSNQWVINPGQGFFVRSRAGVANPVVNFNNAMRVGNVHNPQFFRTANPDNISRLWIEVNNGERYSQAALVYSSTATLGMDAGREGLVLNNGGTVVLYSVAEGNDLAIQARPEFTTSDIVPMGYLTETAGQYTINVRAKDGIFETGQNVYIKDNVTGQVTDITNGSYTFTTEAGTFNERFEILYTTTALGTETPVLNANNVIVYKDDAAINITAGSTQIKDVTIYDLRGRKLYSKSGINATTASVAGLQASQQMLIVEVNTENGKASKKIIF